MNVPGQHIVAKQFHDLLLLETKKLIMSSWHEERLTGLLILVSQYKNVGVPNKKTIFDFYLSHAACINNWDLADSGTEYIVRVLLQDKPEKMRVLGLPDQNYSGNDALPRLRHTHT